jgi:hypothetical protein
MYLEFKNVESGLSEFIVDAKWPGSQKKLDNEILRLTGRLGKKLG